MYTRILHCDELLQRPQQAYTLVSMKRSSGNNEKAYSLFFGTRQFLGTHAHANYAGKIAVLRRKK